MLSALALLAATAGPANVLLVTIDTLRADHVGAYGDAKADTTGFDRLAREGVLVEDAVSHVPETRPSHASILTGRYPYEHGIRDNAAGPIAPGMPTLATLLKAAGYDTAAFIGAYPVSRSSGLDRGFDVYDDPFEKAVDGRTERRAQEVVDRALGWLGRPHARPFLTWVHLFDPHAPYTPPQPFASRFAGRLYDGEVAYADSQLRRLLGWLDGSGQRANTLVVVTSDHGESLGEHGEEEHGLLVYDATLHVPLVLSWPGHLPAAVRVRGQFRSVDLLPTLLGLLGLPAVETSGASRADVLARGGRIPDNESYAESLYGAIHFGWARLRALRSQGWKYIEAPRPELYHLGEDPGELRNVLSSREAVASGMRQSLGRFGGGVGDKAAAAPIDQGALERLAALGYVGGVGSAVTVTGKDPKDGVREVERERQGMREALRLFKQNDIDRALPLLEELARGKTGSFNVEFYLGRALLAKARPREAIPHLRRAMDAAPQATTTAVYLAQAQLAAGLDQDAAATVARGLERSPDNPDLLEMKGRLLLRQDDAAGARAALEKAVGLAPRNARVRAGLSDAFRQLGDFTRAESEAREAERLDPDSPAPRVARGLALAASDREAEAAEAFRSALKLAPENPEALYYLAAVELNAGHGAEARRLLHKLLAVSPGYPGADEALRLAQAQPGSRVPAAAQTVTAGEGTAHLRLIRVASRPQAEELLRQLAAGARFEDLARSVSVDASAPQGGDLGVVLLSDLAPPLRAAAEALPPDGVSGVIEIPGGYALLRRER
ncbi:MAG TPA: sulfatase-like hydrolase/transferase [Vicinamibacteria bacterium]|nr:sulfatase-like hydrolase/transferase [Vicinamibacteria bacterium]